MAVSAGKIWPDDVIEVRDWFDRMVPYFEVYGQVGRFDDNDDQWQNYAVNIVKLVGISVISLPDPYQYDDWRGWAQRMCEVLP